ncbi:hypothetical protein LINGRAHAP2_LOCUS3412 [Linum grandiflorum]
MTTVTAIILRKGKRL